MASRRRGRGEGGIEQLPSGSWRGVVCRTKPDGKRTRQSRTFPKKAELLAWMASVRETGPAEAGTAGEWFDRWLVQHERRVAPKTHQRDEWTVKAHIRPAFGTDKLRDITPEMIEDKLDKLACSDGERFRVAATLRKCLNAAVKAKVLAVAPIGGKKVKMPPKPKASRHSLTEEDLATLLAAADARGLGHAVRLWVDGAMRPSEFLGLQWGDFDEKAGTIRVERSVCIVTGQLKDTKTPKSRRTLPLAPSTAAAVLAVRPRNWKPDAPLLPTLYGHHWWLGNFSEHVFRPLVEAAGVTCTPYTLRHTAATLLLRKGVPLKVVSERLGHEDVGLTLSTYAHVLPDDQGRAAAAVEGLFPTFSPRRAEASP